MVSGRHVAMAWMPLPSTHVDHAHRPRELSLPFARQIMTKHHMLVTHILALDCMHATLASARMTVAG
ncbi:hypothetical protein PsYK624_090790 [Phanerochaete sordida]|uniref:Uncharacterized protein n=1 Tax=Phanerochaete sordida TaxID=48140 RepID=A0A9P3LF39_9APHY|nr:hypothetical protein PsYK624_090790 [Phanerochaete sordida]